MAKHNNKHALSEKEKDFFIRHSSDILTISGFDGYFKRVSPSFTKTVGWTTEELLSTVLGDGFHIYLGVDRCFSYARVPCSAFRVFSFHAPRICLMASLSSRESEDFTT